MRSDVVNVVISPPMRVPPPSKYMVVMERNEDEGNAPSSEATSSTVPCAYCIWKHGISQRTTHRFTTPGRCSSSKQLKMCRFLEE